MYSFAIIILCASLFYPSIFGIYFRNFPHQPENYGYDFDRTSGENQSDILNMFNNNSEINYNLSQYRPKEQHLAATSNVLVGETFRALEANSTSPESSTKIMPNTQSTRVEIPLTENFSNESHSTNSASNFSVNPTTTTTGRTKSAITSSAASSKEEIILSSTEEEEEEGVVRGQPTTTELTNTTISKTESIYQKALRLINDTYTLSILIPVVAGIVFASTILITIATCKCLRRQCRRRRLRRKTLPDSVKNLRPSDRARLLAESSDEEF